MRKIKGLTHEIQELMKRDENAKGVQVKLEKLIQLYENAKTAQESVIVLLPKEEQESQSDWFKHVTKYNTDFMEDVKQRLFETGGLFLQKGHVTT